MNADTRISSRWGIPEFDRGNVIIPEPIFRFHGELGVTGNYFVLIVQLASFKFEVDGSIACPSYQTLADRMGITRRRVIQLVERLESDGWLEITHRSTRTNEYSFKRFSIACWDLYRESLVKDSSLVLVKDSSPEEQEPKNKNQTPKTKLLQEAPNGSSCKSTTSPFLKKQVQKPKPSIEELRKFPDQTPEQIAERLRACIVDAKSESHSNRIGLFGDLLLSHEASPAFVEAVGDFSSVYSVIAQIQTRYPWAMMIDMWSARLPWKPGVTEWKRYLWGAVKGYYAQWSGEQEVKEQEVNNAIPERFERLLGEMYVRPGDVSRSSNDAQPAFNFCIESVKSRE